MSEGNEDLQAAPLGLGESKALQISVPSNATPKESGVIPAQTIPDQQTTRALVGAVTIERAEWAVSDALTQAGRRGFVDEKFSEMLRVGVYLREDELQRALRREEIALGSVASLRQENERLKIAFEGLKHDHIAGMQFGPVQQILIGLGGAFLGTGIGIALAPTSLQPTIPPWLPIVIGLLLMLLGILARKLSAPSK